ncbi:glycoside hydrolase family 6 protein [Nocardioides mangrovi]|uniref:Glucanase n=1 Tax=Nocardioides mangrovi TaxID=2874580 RepID=A0ABS7UB81_9ACTN|nr:glycoside hydrolase family 6 protein [Nocardioides mangrovi]MBZ5738110.1 glycoside hydrolase family 6 protein [Nocardioides mangrovi]
MLPRDTPLRSRALVTVVALLAVPALVGTGAALASDTPAAGTTYAAPAAHAEQHQAQAKPQRRDPRRSQGLFVDPKMPAYNQGGVYRTRIGQMSQAFWVIPEAYGTDAVRAKVNEYTGDALAAHKTPVLSVYGIPGRDCGQYSSGNPLTTAAQYRAWISQLAKGLEKKKALVVLEPDALALFSSSTTTCPTKPAGWQQMLRFASKKLSSTGAWVYLDAGHSNWTPYDDRPSYLKQAGVKYTRGISTNVSNFRPTAAEKKYAALMLKGLRKLGIKHKHYVIDTSRNGATPPADAGYDTINPTWARLGKKPRLVFQGAFDGTLWVKHPGESDGTVNGGPPSGQWCDFLADRLLHRPESTSC